MNPRWPRDVGQATKHSQDLHLRSRVPYLGSISASRSAKRSPLSRKKLTVSKNGTMTRNRLPESAARHRQHDSPLVEIAPSSGERAYHPRARWKCQRKLQEPARRGRERTRAMPVHTRGIRPTGCRSLHHTCRTCNNPRTMNLQESQQCKPAWSRAGRGKRLA